MIDSDIQRRRCDTILSGSIEIERDQKHHPRAAKMGHPQRRALRLRGAMVLCARRSKRSKNDPPHESMGHPPLVPKFNTAIAANGGNPNFVCLMGGTIEGVSARGD